MSTASYIRGPQVSGAGTPLGALAGASVGALTEQEGKWPWLIHPVIGQCRSVGVVLV